VRFFLMLGNGKNGEGGKDESERNLHGWRRKVVAYSVGVKPAEALPASLYAVGEQKIGVASIYRCPVIPRVWSRRLVATIQIALGDPPIVAAEINSRQTTQLFGKYGDEIA
jgi:hypothetical protein